MPGCADIVVHDIKLKDRQTTSHKETILFAVCAHAQVKQEIDNMKSAGIIEQSQSSYAAPIVYVPKKDQTLRFCVDHRNLNSKTVFDPQYMPKIDDILNKVGKAKFLIKIGLTKGY